MGLSRRLSLCYKSFRNQSLEKLESIDLMGKSQKWAECVHPCVHDQGLISALTDPSEILHRAWQSQCDCCALYKFSEGFVNKNGWLWANEILQDFSLRCTFYSHCYEYGTQKIQTPATACLKNHALFMICYALLWLDNGWFYPITSLAFGPFIRWPKKCQWINPEESE